MDFVEFLCHVYMALYIVAVIPDYRKTEDTPTLIGKYLGFCLVTTVYLRAIGVI